MVGGEPEGHLAGGRPKTLTDPLIGQVEPSDLVEKTRRSALKGRLVQAKDGAFFNPVHTYQQTHRRSRAVEPWTD